jgi:hypothetical protein
MCSLYWGKVRGILVMVEKTGGRYHLENTSVDLKNTIKMGLQ